ncbi:MAG: hypothetical protein IPM54_22945 [Polyangiaceae bacterium]|nr:hypothetical protein [Polyangiaceae bacterium]
MAALPTMRTPIERCEEKSLHTQGMLSKFSDVPALVGLETILAKATNGLLAKQLELIAKRKALIVLRIEVAICDRISDQVVRACLKRAQIEDGEAGGRIATTLFPNGSTPIIKPVGSTQVDEMRQLEGRYDNVTSIYPAAIDDKNKVATERSRYETALGARKSGIEQVTQALAARDLAKEEFLDVFAEVAARIQAAFPRDKKTQDLFFLKDKAARDEGDEEESSGEGE